MLNPTEPEGPELVLSIVSCCGVSANVCLCIRDRTSGLILFVLQQEQCHIAVLDRFRAEHSDGKLSGCTEPMGRMESWMARGGWGRWLWCGGQPATDMTQDPQSKQSFQTDYHSCLFEEG